MLRLSFSIIKTKLYCVVNMCNILTHIDLDKSFFLDSNVKTDISRNVFTHIKLTIFSRKTMVYRSTYGDLPIALGDM